MTNPTEDFKGRARTILGWEQNQKTLARASVRTSEQAKATAAARVVETTTGRMMRNLPADMRAIQTATSPPSRRGFSSPRVCSWTGVTRALSPPGRSC